jgi:predicted GTPase
MSRDEQIARALALIAALETQTLSLKQLVDRIELVSNSPQETRAILDAATRRGIIDRDGSQIAIRDRSVAPAVAPEVVVVARVLSGPPGARR